MPIVKPAYRAPTSVVISDVERPSGVQQDIPAKDENPIITLLKRELDAEKIESA
jgi:hypothetical protein